MVVKSVINVYFLREMFGELKKFFYTHSHRLIFARIILIFNRFTKQFFLFCAIFHIHISRIYLFLCLSSVPFGRGCILPSPN